MESFIYKDIYRYLYMTRTIEVKKDELILRHKKIEVLLERTVTQFGTSAKADVPKKYIGRRAYVIIVRD